MNTSHCVRGFVVFKALKYTFSHVYPMASHEVGKAELVSRFPFRDDVTEVQRDEMSFLKVAMDANPEPLIPGLLSASSS